MILVCRDEISPRPAGIDLTHVENKFRSCEAGQLCTYHLWYAISLYFSL